MNKEFLSYKAYVLWGRILSLKIQIKKLRNLKRLTIKDGCSIKLVKGVLDEEEATRFNYEFHERRIALDFLNHLVAIKNEQLKSLQEEYSNLK